MTSPRAHTAQCAHRQYPPRYHSVWAVRDDWGSGQLRCESLYGPSKRFHPPLGEVEPRARICPPSVLATRLDRLSGAVGLDTVELEIIPFTAALKLPPATAFWVYDDSLVIVEAWHSELWIEDEPSVNRHLRTWNTLRESAAYGTEAHQVISTARQELGAA
ncbi:Scr1 family TA system antitoxin-like transcriptional regulator [Streptomyces scabiei]|uniref:Scr1 family TA system antitoxin-like transcriptional regulator n=1 Tax=Streptomyces scabiei TaxID=1930 RepID=UPI003F4D2E7E